MEKLFEENVLVAEQPRRQGLKVAYMMSRFPKITETFVLFEMLAVEEQGVQIELYPLLREKTEVMHPEAVAYVERANFQPFISREILGAHGRFLRRKPLTYLQTLGRLLWANFGSKDLFVGALGIFPKVVYFAEKMEKEGIEHIHAHFATHPAAAAWIIHRLVDIPYTFMGHGSDLNRYTHMLREKVIESKYTFPISQLFREMIVKQCGEQYRHKVQVVHCGVDMDVFEYRTTPTSHEIGEGPFKIFCVGTLHEVKGQTYLIQACNLLQERGVDFECHFVADGPDWEMLQQQVNDLGLTERVRFHGRVTREEVVELLSDADMLATPSVPASDGKREGIPVVIMEAMARGVPVVASRLSGIPEIVRDEETGLLADPRDYRKLADQIERLYDDVELRKRLNKAGREMVINEFDLNRNVARLIEFFSSGSY